MQTKIIVRLEEYKNLEINIRNLWAAVCWNFGGVRSLQVRSLFPYQFLHDFSKLFVTGFYWKEKYCGSWLFGLTVWSCKCFCALKTELVGWGAVSTVPSAGGHVKEEYIPYHQVLLAKQ